MHIDGACLCGAIQYGGRIDPGRIAICIDDMQRMVMPAIGGLDELEELLGESA